MIIQIIVEHSYPVMFYHILSFTRQSL